MLQRILSEPYRIFFPLGVFFGALGVGHWLVYASGLTESYSGFMHASIQIQMYMTCFILGFLMTAIPRMHQAQPLTLQEASVLGILLALLTSFTAFEAWLSFEVVYAGLIVFLFTFFIRRVRAGKRSGEGPPPGFVWVPMALLFALTGSLLLALGHGNILGSWALAFGEPLLHEGFVFCVVLGVGSFLAPRLMGTVKASPVQLDEADKRAALKKKRKIEMSLHLLSGLLFFASFACEKFLSEQIAFGIRALIVSWVFISTRSLVFAPRVKHQYVWLVWGSFWMVFLGAWSLFIFPTYHLAGEHVIFIGGYTLMTFAVGAMVIFSHAGAAEQLRKFSWQLMVVALSVFAALVFRATSTFFPDYYFNFLAISALLWLVAAFAWFLYVGRHLFSFPTSSTFEREHEQAKETCRPPDANSSSCCDHEHS